MQSRGRSTPLADDAGIRAAYAAHGAELYRAAWRLTGDGHQAEDIVQETFVRAWRAADRFDERLGSMRTWLFGILRNIVIDSARAAAVRPQGPLPGTAAEASSSLPVLVADDIDRALLAWQLDEALARLSADHRRVLVEVHLNGRPVAEVARALHVPVGTVKSRPHYALRALRGVLEEMGWTESTP